MVNQTASARERVRAARAARDAERKAREKQVDRAAEEYLKAGDALAAAQQAGRVALSRQGRAVQELLDLGETLTSIGAYLGVAKADVKTALQAHQDTAGAGSAAGRQDRGGAGSAGGRQDRGGAGSAGGSTRTDPDGGSEGAEGDAA